MSKKPLLKITIESPSFAEIQKHWYGVLAKEGFNDQENTEAPGRPLKQWSGVSSIYVDVFQPPGAALVSSFPQSVYREEESFKKHPEFKRICSDLAKDGRARHKNRPGLTPITIELIWSDYCEGLSLRVVAAKYKTSDTRIFRIIHGITEWMNLMDTRLENENEETAVIVLRNYKPDTDNPIIYATWRNALWFDEKRDESFGNEFFSLATKQIRQLLKRNDAVVRIACKQDDPSFIAGYAVLTGTHLDMVYVKADYRKQGIAKLLTKGFTTIAQPGTKLGIKLAEKWNLEVKENHEVIQ